MVFTLSQALRCHQNQFSNNWDIQRYLMVYNCNKDKCCLDSCDLWKIRTPVNLQLTDAAVKPQYQAEWEIRTFNGPWRGFIWSWSTKSALQGPFRGIYKHFYLGGDKKFLLEALVALMMFMRRLMWVKRTFL